MEEVKRLMGEWGLSQEVAGEIVRELHKGEKSLAWYKNVLIVNEVLQHGIERIILNIEPDLYEGKMDEFRYINMGDTYSLTFVENPEDGKVILSSWGDVYEKCQEMIGVAYRGFPIINYKLYGDDIVFQTHQGSDDSPNGRTIRIFHNGVCIYTGEK